MLMKSQKGQSYYPRPSEALQVGSIIRLGCDTTGSNPACSVATRSQKGLKRIFLLVLVLASAGITNWVDHVSDGSTPGSAVLCELTRRFHPVLSPSWSGDRFQVGLERGCPCLQLATSSSAPRARRCGNEKVLDQLTFGTSCGMTKPASLTKARIRIV